MWFVDCKWRKGCSDTSLKFFQVLFFSYFNVVLLKFKSHPVNYSKTMISAYNFTNNFGHQSLLIKVLSDGGLDKELDHKETSTKGKGIIIQTQTHTNIMTSYGEKR